MKENFFDNIKAKLSSVIFALKFVYGNNKAYLFLVFAGELLNTLKVLPYIYLSKIAVTLLMGLSDYKIYISSVTSILLLILVMQLSIEILTQVKTKHKKKLDFSIKEQMIEKNDTMDYFTLSTKEYFVLQSKAMEGYALGCIEKNVSLCLSVVSNIVLLIGIIYIISSLGIVLILPICVTIVVRILSEYFDRNANYIRTTEMSNINKKSNYLHKICENIHYAKEIRIFNLEKKFDSKLKEMSNEKTSIWKKYMRVFRYSSATHIIADIVLQLVIYLVLAYRVLMLKIITIGDFVFLFAAYQQLQGIMGSLALNHINIFLNARYLQDFMKYWSFRPLKIDDREGGKMEYIKNDDIVIEFKNVYFRYPNTDFYALSDVNVTLKKGETYLVVGKNGAGKSTFVKLLCRLYSPTDGEITLNGKNILEYDRESYLSLLSVMFQDYKMLNLTIAENISSFESMNDKKLFNRVITSADISDKIRSLPNKENTPYGKEFDEKGVEFSGGEVQKIMIAKTLYKKALLKIFDEPTAGLDAVAENKIYENIKQESKSGILIYITHRLSVGVKSNNILVFSSGRIAETGNHNQLMSRRGIYASLFESQATLYGEDKHK